MALSFSSLRKPLGVASTSEKLGLSSPCTPTLLALPRERSASWRCDCWRGGPKQERHCGSRQGGGKWVDVHLLHDNLRKTPWGPMAVPPSNRDFTPPKLVLAMRSAPPDLGCPGWAFHAGRLGRRVDPEGDTVGFCCWKCSAESALRCSRVRAWAVKGDKEKRLFWGPAREQMVWWEPRGLRTREGTDVA